MKIRNAPLGFVIASGVLACSLYLVSDVESLNVGQEQRNNLEMNVQSASQPAGERLLDANSEYITPIK